MSLAKSYFHEINSIILNKTVSVNRLIVPVFFPIKQSPKRTVSSDYYLHISVC